MDSNIKKQRIINDIMALLFSISPNDNCLFQKTLEEMISNYYCDLAIRINSLPKIITHCKTLIDKELIDYVQEEINKLSCVSLSESSSLNLSNINKKYSDRINKIEDENIKNKLNISKESVNLFLDYEVSKTEDFRKKILSRSNSVYETIYDLINKIKNSCYNIRERITEAELMLEASKFLTYYFIRNNIKGTEIADITFINTYDEILNDIVNIYSSWNGGE